MRKYIKPEIRISMFHTESISAQEPLALSAVYGDEINKFIPNNSSDAVKRNYSFNKAIKFK